MLLVALLVAGCSSGDAGGDGCPAGQLYVCRAASDCRCGPPCALGSRCPAGLGGAPVCLELADSTGMGVCVDVSWASGAPPGMIRCGQDLCPATSSCVNWGSAGVHCGAPCMTNAQCPSGCCAVVSDRDTSRTFNVCAPSASFRCLPGMTAGLRCDPACGDRETCVATSSAPRCARECASDDDCAGACCAEVMGGGRACAPAGSACGAPLTPACTSFDECVTVTYAARGDHCGGSVDSVEVRVRNGCTRAADVQICYERRDGTCTCGLHRDVAPGAEPSPAFWACDLTGRFRISARAAGDAPGCHPGTCN